MITINPVGTFWWIDKGTCYLLTAARIPQTDPRWSRFLNRFAS